MTDGCGLPFIDFAFAALGFACLAEILHHVIAVAITAAGLSGFNAPAQTAPQAGRKGPRIRLAATAGGAAKDMAIGGIRSKLSV